jgi:D-alanyl-D-alanine carboxypeptidase/D-alanyl-D-alanine-endopeptidase (penicillin-binding protein 4)
MGRWSHLRLACGPLLAAALVLAAPAGGTGTALGPRLERALRVPHVDPGRTAALAVDLRTGSVVYSRNESLSLVPASTEKLPVAFASLTVLGGDYRFGTEVAGVGEQAGAVWRGNLVLRGFGDPTLDTADLEALAADIAALGIERVAGGIVADESWFDNRRTGPGWLPRFYLEESPPLSALVVDRAMYRGRVSTNPALAAASLFRAALEARGVRVARRSRVGARPPQGLLLARDVSPPLARIVRFMGRESDNFTAELLVKHLGVLDAPAGVPGTTARGLRVVRATIEEAGVPLGGVRLVDGSGLARSNRITAAALVSLLEAGLARPDIRDAFLASLAVAGVDGTLEHRLERRPARGRVIAKTGTTRVASALSGFVRGRYVFAVIQNGAPVSTYWSRRAQDRFAAILAAAP